MRDLFKTWARNLLADQLRGQLVGHRDVLNIRDIVRFTGAPAVVEEDNDVLVTIQPRSFSLVIARLFTIFADPIAVVNPGRVTKCCLLADLVFIYRTVFLVTSELTRRIQRLDIQSGDLCKFVRFWGVDELDGAAELLAILGLDLVHVRLTRNNVGHDAADVVGSKFRGVIEPRTWGDLVSLICLRCRGRRGQALLVGGERLRHIGQVFVGEALDGHLCRNVLTFEGASFSGHGEHHIARLTVSLSSPRLLSCYRCEKGAIGVDDAIAEIIGKEATAVVQMHSEREVADI